MDPITNWCLAKDKQTKLGSNSIYFPQDSTLSFILQCRSNRKNSTINRPSHTKWSVQENSLEIKEYQSNQVKREVAKKHMFLKYILVPDVILEK